MLMMRGGFGSESPGQHQLMLMMLGALGHQHQLMLMIRGGFGSESPGQHQLMLMMLGALGLKARASTS